VQYSYQKLTTDTAVAGINYKEQLECDPMIFTNYITCTGIFKFL